MALYLYYPLSEKFENIYMKTVKTLRLLNVTGIAMITRAQKMIIMKEKLSKKYAGYMTTYTCSDLSTNYNR